MTVLNFAHLLFTPFGVIYMEKVRILFSTVESVRVSFRFSTPLMRH
jgi:hypothetical protein